MSSKPQTFVACPQVTKRKYILNFTYFSRKTYLLEEVA